MTKSIIVLSLGVAMLLFQNCQKAGFGGEVDGLSKSQGELTPVVVNDPEDLKNPGDSTGDVRQPGSEVEEPSPSETLPPGSGSETPPQPLQVIDPNATGLFVCILDGPGKSVKLGMSVEGQLRGQNKIPQVVCMTREACLDIASRVFVVKGPERRGYCKASGGNPHVSRPTNGEIELKVQALEVP